MAYLTLLTALGMIASMGCGWWFSRRFPRSGLVMATDLDSSGKSPPESAVTSYRPEARKVIPVTPEDSTDIHQKQDENKKILLQARENEEYSRVIEELTEIGTADWDFKTNTMRCSTGFIRLFSFAPDAGMNRDELIALIHPLDKEQVVKEQQRVFEEGGSYETEYRILNKDGKERSIHERGRLVIRDGVASRMIAAFIDITNRKKAEAARLSSELRFRGTFENAGIGVAHVGFDDRFMLVNKGMRSKLGYDDTLLGKSLSDITFSDDRDLDKEKRQAILRHQLNNYDVDKRLVTSGGDILWATLTFSLQHDNEGQPEYFILAFRDITVQHRAQEDLQERLKEIEALYDNTPIGLALINRHRRFMRVNRALADLNGLAAVDHMGRSLWDILPHLKAALEPAIEHTINTGEGLSLEVPGRSTINPDDSRYWYNKIYPVFGSDGSVKAVGMTVEDITEDKQAEEHLRFLMRELSHRSKNLLAVIQGMANQTSRFVENVEEFRRRFRERLMGIAASHDLLVHRNWVGVSLKKLVYGQLAAFVESDDHRVTIHGPEIDLTSGATEAMGLALHELATNSVKYGALRDPAGRVDINWEIADTLDVTGKSHRRLHIGWTEHTSSPVTSPGRKGFGWIVIERMIQASLQGQVTIEFPPEGMRWRIDASMASLVSETRIGAA